MRRGGGIFGIYIGGDARLRIGGVARLEFYKERHFLFAKVGACNRGGCNSAVRACAIFLNRIDPLSASACNLCGEFALRIEQDGTFALKSRRKSYAMACGRDIICGVQRRNNARKPKIQDRGCSDVRAEGSRSCSDIQPRRIFCAVSEIARILGADCIGGVLSSFFNSRLYASAARFGAGTTSRISMLAVMMIVRKVAMEAVAFESAAVYYPLCAIFLSGAINLTVFALHSGGAKFVCALSSKRIITAGILMSAVSSATIFFGNLSALYVPNPAYLSALSLTAPLWIMVADKFLGVPDKVDSRWLAAMLLSICALIFFAQIPIAPPSDSPVSAGGHAPVAAK